MGTIRDPVRFSTYYDVDPDTLSEMGVFDPTLNVDTRLFIDPLLLRTSTAPEISDGAAAYLRQYFENIITLLRASTERGDPAWREAQRRFEFHEVAATCLGYGAGSIIGSGFGSKLTSQVLETADEIVSMGVEDPDIFLLIPLLEEGIGPDRISDMTTNIIIEHLAEFTVRVLDTIGIEDARTTLTIGEGEYELLENPCFDRSVPVLLLPTDILRDLPVASDWREVRDAAATNAQIRRQVNEEIGEIWHAQTKREKRRRRERILRSREALEALLDSFHGVDATSYDVEEDPQGYLRWRNLLDFVAEDFPFTIEPPERYTAEEVNEVVDTIIDQFEFLIEERRLSRLLWHDDKPLREFASQLIFFSVAYSYCKANDLDVTPEADTGSGIVDFKVSRGFDARVLVEVKLSRNHKLVSGYQKQLEAYREAEETIHGHYVVVDVGNMGDKGDRIEELRQHRLDAGEEAPAIWFIDGIPRESASRL